MTRPDGFTCVHCGATSHNRHDVDNRYCGGCHHFCDDVPMSTFTHPKCLCDWVEAASGGFYMTRQNEGCPVHPRKGVWGS